LSFTPEYGVMQWRETWLLWHKPVLLEQVFMWYCQQQSLPLPSRPLLVPVKQSLSIEQCTEAEQYLPLLRQVGINARMDNQTLNWQSTPIILPQLPLSTLIEKVLQAKPQTVQDMLTLAVNEHLTHASPDEEATRETILAFFDAHRDDIRNDRITGILRMTDSHCRNIIYG